MGDLKEANVVFVASMRFRTLADELERPRAFTFSGEKDGTVVDPRPEAGQPAMYETGEGVDDHAIVSVWPGQVPGRTIVTLQGRTTWATQAAGEYVTRPDYLAELAKQLDACRRAHRQPLHPASDQVLLRVRIRDDQPVSIGYVTHHDL